MKQRIITSIAIFGFMAAAIIAFLIVPTIRDIHRLNIRINEERSGLESRYARRNTVRKAIDFVEEIRVQLPALQSIVVPAGDEINLVSSIEDVAERTGVTHEIKLTPPTDLTKSGFDRRLDIEITARGDGLAIGKFFEEIERLPPAFLIEILLLNKGSQTETTTVTANWRASVAWPEQLY